MYNETKITKIYAGISYPKIDQNTSIILDKENIPSDAHGDQSHVGISTATTTGGALSASSGKHSVIVLCTRNMVSLTTRSDI